MKLSAALLALPCWLHSAAASPAKQGLRSLIYGGSVATVGDYPFYVQSSDATCGGVLVAPDLVLTTSTCRSNFVEEVLVGSGKLSGGPDGNQGQWRSILSEIIVHSDADPSGTRDGFALFRIEPVTLDGIRPVTLNTNLGNPVLGQELTVAGFGQIPSEDDASSYYSANIPDELMEATVRVADNDVCKAMVEYGGSLVYDKAAMLCTLADTVTGRGPCYGDYGGPLVDENQTLIGVISGNAYCSSPYTPSIYISVAGNYDWIQRTMCRLTADQTSLPFDCPDFLCPLDGSILGYPTAALPSAADGTLSYNGFDPVDVTQVPAAGTALPANGTTVVTVTATDASGRAETCDWIVKVPALQYVGGVDFPLPRGSQTEELPSYMWLSGTTGLVYRMEAIFYYNKLVGRNASVTATLRQNDTSYEPILALAPNDYNGTVEFSDPVAFSGSAYGSCSVNVTSSGVMEENYMTINLYGQIKQ